MDWPIALGFGVNLATIIGGASKAISVLVSVRDELHDLGVKVGTRNPPDGILGDLENIKTEIRRHRDRLIELEVNGGLKHRDRT